MAKRCGSVAGGRQCPRPARRLITLTVPGHEAFPIKLFRCDDCLWAWDKYDRPQLDQGVDVRVGELEGG